MKISTGLVVAALAVSSSYADETKHLRSISDEDESNGVHTTALQSTPNSVDDSTNVNFDKPSGSSSGSGVSDEAFVAKLIGSGSGQIPLNAILYAFDNDGKADEEDNALAKKRHKIAFSDTVEAIDGSVLVDMDKFSRHWDISNSGSGSGGKFNIKEIIGSGNSLVSIDKLLDFIGIDRNGDDDDDVSINTKDKNSLAKHTQVDDSDDWSSDESISKRKNVNVKGVETESEDSEDESTDGNALQLEPDSSDDNVNVKQPGFSKNSGKSSGNSFGVNDVKPETQGEEFDAGWDDSGKLDNDVNVKQSGFTKSSGEPSGKLSSGMDKKIFTQGGEDDEDYLKFDSTDDNVNVKQPDSSKNLDKSSGQFSVDNDPKPETQGEEFGADWDESGKLDNDVNVKQSGFTKSSGEPSGKLSSGMDKKFFTQGGEDDEDYSKFGSTDDSVNVKQPDSSKNLGKSSGQFSNVKNGNLGTEDEDTDN